MIRSSKTMLVSVAAVATLFAGGIMHAGEDKDRGFVILGFPANNFGHQEPGTDAEIKSFCTSKYNVSFDLFSKISVKGSDQHPLYTFLTSKATDPEFSGDIQWNFQKFLIGRSGKIIARFAPGTEPLSSEITDAVEKALKE